MSNDLAMKTLCEASELLDNKEVSPAELLEATLARINEDQGKYNAFVTVVADKARAAAKACGDEIAKHGRKSALHGIPVALKDLFYTKGILTTAGSNLMKDFVPDTDSPIAAKLYESGAVLVGKTVTHEFAYGPTTESSLVGPARNPWNPERITGGSSGGSAVAAATGMSYMAMGSDTGGSIRIPGGLCGVVGFKPTFGSLSLKDVVPLSWSFDTAGPLVRSVKDAAVTMDVLSDEPGRFTWKLATISGDKPLKGLTAGVPKNFFFDKIDPDISANVRKAIAALGELGATIKEIEIPGLDQVQRITNVIMSVEAFYLHKKNLETRWDEYQDDVRTRIVKGGDYSGYDYVSAVKEREAMQEVMNGVWENVDVLLAASVPAPAYTIGSWKIMLAGVEEEARVMMTRHTRLQNLTGGPGLTVPCGFTRETLPCGLQFMGKPGNDATVLKAGYAYELTHPIKFPVR